MNIEELTLSEIQDLVAQLTARYNAILKDHQTQSSLRRERIGGSIAALETLLGPVDGEPGIDSIRDVRRYDDQTVVDHAGLAFQLIFAALEQLTVTTRDIAAAVSD